MNSSFYKKIVDNVNISLMSKIALVLAAINCITLFVGYSVIDYDAEEWMYEFSIHFQLVDIIALAINLIPYVLLELFYSKHRDNVKLPILLAIVLGLFSLNRLYIALNCFSYRPVLAIVNIVFSVMLALFACSSIYKKIYYDRFDNSLIITIIFAVLAFAHIINSATYIGDYYYKIDFWDVYYLIFAVLFVISMVSVLKGLSNKLLVIITLSIGLLLKIVNLINFLGDIGELCESGRYLYLFTYPAGIICEGVLYISLLFFVLKNKLPIVITHIKLPPIIMRFLKREKKNSPEQELRTLKDKLELGMITEEEYQTQRAEIISKL